MASVDQGASERRGTYSSYGRLSQQGDVTQLTAQGESYFTGAALQSGENGLTWASRYGTTSPPTIPLSVTNFYLPNYRGYTYWTGAMSRNTEKVSTIASGRVRPSYAGIGTGVFNVTGTRGTSYWTGRTRKDSQSVTPVTYYKLLAWNGGTPVVWVSTYNDYTQAPQTGLTNLSIVDQWTVYLSLFL